MRSPRPWWTGGATLVLGGAAAMGQQPLVVDADSFGRDLRPLVAEHCGDCHDGDRRKGELDLLRFTELAAVENEPAVWQLVRERLQRGDMPPADAPQPDAATRLRLQQQVAAMLGAIARKREGDPGPVVLRRLDNASYTFAIADLTGVPALEPAREFPADGAAGEGFTNVGDALPMSPLLLEKYLAAGKSIAAHAVLLPDGIRFSAATSQRDQTEELLAAIRALYARHTAASVGERVDLQGIVFATNGGGRLPLAGYLAALAPARTAPMTETQLATLATERSLSRKYLTTLHAALIGDDRSLLLDQVRERWRRGASPAEVAEFVGAWQQQLFAFRTVGHIGKVGGPQQWQEPMTPLLAQQQWRQALPATGGDVVVHLVVDAVGDLGGEVIWRQPRLQAAGRPEVLLREVSALTAAWHTRRALVTATVAPTLTALTELERRGDGALESLAAQHAVRADILRVWARAVGLAGQPTPSPVLLPDTVRGVAGHAVVNGFADGELPSVVANAGDQALRIPGPLAPHAVVVHPTPTVRSLVVWRSPVATRVRMAARIQHTHTDCGNGVAWSLQVRRGDLRLELASGIAVTDDVVTATPPDPLAVAPGDQVVLVVAARDGDHRCDLTRVDLTITAPEPATTGWDLAADVAADLVAGNPHADRHGNAGIWWFGSEPDVDDGVVPAGSLLAQWLLSERAEERQRLAGALAALLGGDAAGAAAADVRLRSWLLSIDGPFAVAMGAADPDSDLVITVPGRRMFVVPAEIAVGRTLVATAEMPVGAAQARIVVDAEPTPGPVPAPILVGESANARPRLELALAAFRALFPAALCYEQIVPVDEVITLTQFHREDDHLVRLLLDDGEAADLERRWQELHFVSQDALTAVDSFAQLWQYATQDADPSAFEPLRAPIRQRAAAFAVAQVAAEPRHVDAVLEFAGRAFRRPLTDGERKGLLALYADRRHEGIDHDAAIRLLLTRILVSPAFLYRAETPGPGREPTPLAPYELAARLSFFLWSSIPDGPLRALAANGRLADPTVLAREARRLLADPRARRLGTEFACTWLQIRDFGRTADKSERHFPEFAALRPALHEEVIRWFLDLLQRDGSVLELLDGDATFVDGALAAHYGIPGVTGPGWRRVDGVRAHGRGGILGFGAVLAAQAGASRTSPILRGNWLLEVLLGERLPRPPADVPKLPEEDADATATMRQLIERHRRDARCAHCHDRIDAFGFALEEFDAIGRRRTVDAAGRPLELQVTTPDGAQFTGVDGLRHWLLTQRRDAFLRQFARKLLGYALGRAVQIGDEPLLDEVLAQWPAHGHRIGYLIERIVQSRQFRCIRGRQAGDTR
ncbi:MAG: DUF1592 domain-containing protein [Planctomycetes bacterium]|nr:DUF1592 domain-containing protein [Planctomycetota bacterium]